MSGGLLAPHRSIRAFKPDPVPEELLRSVLAEAQRAPTDATAQMYSFVRVRSRELRLAISQACGGLPVVEAAPEFFVVLADLARLGALLALEGRALGQFAAIGLHFATVDASLAAQRMMDAAEAAGLAVCPIGALANGMEKLPPLLRLPPLVMPLFGLCLGYAAEDPPLRPRLPQEVVVHQDSYRMPPQEELQQAARTMNAITRSGHWLGVLARYFAPGGTMEERDGPWRRTLQRQGFL